MQRVATTLPVSGSSHSGFGHNASNFCSRTLRLRFDRMTAEGEWERAPGFPALDNPAEKIYTGLARFSRTIKYSGSEERKIEVVVDYEVCNEDYCLPVSTLNAIRHDRTVTFADHRQTKCAGIF